MGSEAYDDVRGERWGQRRKMMSEGKGTQYIMYSIQYMIYSLQYILHNIQYIMHSIQYTLQNIQYIVYTV